MVIATPAAVNISLQVAVYGYIRIGCQNAIYIVIIAYGIGCGNIYITVNSNVLFCSIPVTCHDAGVFTCIISAGIDYQLVSGKLKLGATVIENLDCCAVGTCCSYSQSFACCINLQVLCGINAVNCSNAAVIGKFIAAVALDNICLSIFRILVCIAGQRRSEISNSRLSVRALAAIVELNLASFNSYAVISQTANNFNSAQQVFRIIYIIAIGQLVSEHIQYAIYLFIIFCIYFAAISYHVDSRILFCITDDNIAAGIISGGGAIIVMRIEYSSIATVIININICFIILENQASISIAVATAESVDMSNTIIFFILRSRK